MMVCLLWNGEAADHLPHTDGFALQGLGRVRSLAHSFGSMHWRISSSFRSASCPRHSAASEFPKAAAKETGHSGDDLRWIRPDLLDLQHQARDSPSALVVLLDADSGRSAPLILPAASISCRCAAVLLGARCSSFILHDTGSCLAFRCMALDLEERLTISQGPLGKGRLLLVHACGQVLPSRRRSSQHA